MNTQKWNAIWTDFEDVEYFDIDNIRTILNFDLGKLNFQNYSAFDYDNFKKESLKIFGNEEFSDQMSYDFHKILIISENVRIKLKFFHDDYWMCIVWMDNNYHIFSFFGTLFIISNGKEYFEEIDEYINFKKIIKTLESPKKLISFLRKLAKYFPN